ncbi:flavin reductase like domain-containing protein [Xylaria nigripes]|nr:flavin reductase like domain-containing protein [Xylaria nigripes]
MLSLRGLRGAMPSVSPRRACSRLYWSFTSSFIWSRTWGAQKLSTLGQWNKSQLEATFAEHQSASLASKVVDSSKITARPGATEDTATLRASTESNKQLEDLCKSVTAVMAKLPHPAVVITTLDQTYDAQAAAGVPIDKMRHPIARGITASSLTSLCVRPKPHVMFNMTLPSTMYDALVACKDFNVHVLTPDESGARIASVFTRGNRLPFPSIGERESPKFAFDIDADLGVFIGLKDESCHHVEIVNREAWHEQYQHAKENGIRASRPSTAVEAVAQEYEVVERARQAHSVPFLRSSGIMEVLNCRLVRAIHPELPGAEQNVVIIGEVVNVTFPRGLGQSNETSVALGYADRKYRSIGSAIHPLK